MELTINDLCSLLDIDRNQLDSKTLTHFKKINRKFSLIQQNELLELYKDIFSRLDSDQQKIGSKIRTKDWQDGWKENLDLYLENPNDEKSLIPKFIRPNKAYRLFQKYIYADDPMFELSIFEIFRSYLIENFIKDFDHVYEFGCGTGFNLYEIAKRYPKKELYGTDFVESSKLLVQEVAKNNSYNIVSDIFDFKKPNYSFQIKPNSVVCTFGALEQINSEFYEFFKYLDTFKPDLIIHSEPMIEHYDKNNFNDYLAYTFYNNRGYTKGMLPYLRERSKKKEINIIKDTRVEFGSTLMEGFNIFIWRYN